jgi:hypothetical protein
MSGYLASDRARLRRLLGSRAGGVYGAGFALLVAHFLLSVAFGPGVLGSPSISSNLIWLALPAACLFVVAGGWFMRRNWLAWSIKRNLLAELLVLAPVVLWWTVVGRPAEFSFAANPLVTLFFMTFVGLVITLLLSAVVLAVRVVVGFFRGHPDDDEPATDATAESAPAETPTEGAPTDAPTESSTAAEDP